MNSIPRHALLLVLLALGACSTPRGSSSNQTGRSASASDEHVDWNVKPPPRQTTGKPVRITFLAYGSGQTFELVNESHTNPHEYYSKKIAIEAAFRKIQSDEVVGAMLDRLKQLGLGQSAMAGAAPKFARGTKAQSFEIETGAGITNWTITERTPVEALKPFVQAKQEFIQVWTATAQMQAVEGDPWRQEGAPKQQPRPVRPISTPGSTPGKVQ